MITEERKEQIKKVALDAVKGLIFTNRHIPSGERLEMVFVILGLLDEEAMQKLKDTKPVMVYEYLEKAGPRSVNGLPMFFSFYHFNQEECDLFMEYARKYESAIADV